jgi:hypothetical protein
MPSSTSAASIPTDANTVTVQIEVDPEQAWFWSQEWQEGERAASAQLAAGEGIFHASDDDFVESLRARRKKR